jgi:hypothetical protein
MIDVTLKNGDRRSAYFDHTRFSQAQELVNSYRLTKHDLEVVRFAFVGDEMDVEKVVFASENIPEFFITFDYISRRFNLSMN